MPAPPKVVIVCSSPIYAAGLLRLLEEEAASRPGEIIPDPALLRPSPDTLPDVVLLAPRQRQEMGEWIGPLQRRLPFTPWLILGELRLAGMFLPRLQQQPCVVVDPARTSHDLNRGVHTALSNHCWHLSTTLLSRLMRALGRRPGAPPARMPTVIELGICCGVSLGLSNREIASALHLSEATIKTHLHRLTTRMGLSSREELSQLVNRALAYQPQTEEADVEDFARRR